MNEPACRAYKAAQYLPSYTAAPTQNSTLRLSLTLTLLLQTDCTLNYRRAARHPNRLCSPFCTKTRSRTAHQQQVHNKSYKLSVGFNVNGRRIEWHTSHRHTDQTVHMTGGVYNFQGRDVLDGTARREGRFGASPTPTQPARLSF